MPVKVSKLIQVLPFQNLAGEWKRQPVKHRGGGMVRRGMMLLNVLKVN